MICKIGLCVMVALAVATCSDAERHKHGGVNRIRSKFGFGSGSAAASAAAGPNGVSSSAAASIPNSRFPYGSHYEPPVQYQAPPVHYTAPPVHYQAPPVRYQAPPVNYPAPPRYPPYSSGGPRLGKTADQHYRTYYEGDGPVERPPSFSYRSDPYAYSHQHGYNGQNRDQRYPAPGTYGKFKGYPESVYPSSDTATWSAAAAATAGGRSHGRKDAAAAAAAASGWNQQQHYVPEYQHRDFDEEEAHEHYYAPESEEYRATTGAFNGPRSNYEEGSRKSETEVVNNHESGGEDEDSLYRANSFGRTSDEDQHTIFNDSNSEKTKTRDLLHERKSNTNFVSTSKKRTQETGSGVHAHNKHSTRYDKDYSKVKDNVDQKYTKRADGLVETNESNSNANIENEDVRHFDTRGLGAHGKPASVGQSNHASPVASASASASAFSSAGR